MKINQKILIVVMFTFVSVFGCCFIGYRSAEARGMSQQKMIEIAKAQEQDTKNKIESSGTKIEKIADWGDRNVYKIKYRGIEYILGEKSVTSAFVKLETWVSQIGKACGRGLSNCNNGSCRNVQTLAEARADSTSKYYAPAVKVTTPPKPPTKTTSSTTIKVGTSTVTNNVTNLNQVTNTPNLQNTLTAPAKVTGPITITATILPSIVNEGQQCKISYEVEKAVSCSLKSANFFNTSLFTGHDGTKKTGSKDVDPATYSLECINDDNVPTQKTLTCNTNGDTRED